MMIKAGWLGEVEPENTKLGSTFILDSLRSGLRPRNEEIKRFAARVLRGEQRCT